jgi:uracil-DNA glycosylase
MGACAHTKNAQQKLRVVGRGAANHCVTATVFRAMAATAPLKTAAPLVPERPTWKSVRAAAARCRACPLWKTGTQTVFGEGPASARILMVGEQPGDREDVEGRAFVGPAARLLDQAVVAAGIARDEVCVTHAVKHFKWEPAGHR